MKSIALLTFTVFLPFVISQCPTADEEPLLYNPDQFLCADIYQGPGDDDPAEACTTCEEYGQFLLEDGGQAVGSEGQYLRIGSMVVMPGCTFLGYEEYNFGGNVTPYEGGSGGLVESYVEGVGYTTEQCDKVIEGFGSFKCLCVQEVVDCEASDVDILIQTCDNPDPVTSSCRFEETIGTSYTDASQASIDVNGEVASEIHAELKNIFAEDVGVSDVTGFDWTTAEASTFEAQETMEIEFAVPPGEYIEVYQTVGYCEEAEGVNESRVRTYLLFNRTHVARYTSLAGQLVQLEPPKVASRPGAEANKDNNSKTAK